MDKWKRFIMEDPLIRVETLAGDLHSRVIDMIDNTTSEHNQHELEGLPDTSILKLFNLALKRMLEEAEMKENR